MKIFRHLLPGLLSYTALIAACAFVMAVGVTFVVSTFHEPELSAWNIVASQVARWFAFWVGIYLIYNLLPVAVAHGRTRREFLGQALLFTVAFAVTLALIAEIGYGAENTIHGWMGWNHGRQGSIGFLPHVLMFLTWTGAGAFVCAAFTRFGAIGSLSLPFGIVIVLTAGLLIPGSGLPFMAEIPFMQGIPGTVDPPWQFVAATLGAWLIALGATWVIARDMPIRTKSA